MKRISLFTCFVSLFVFSVLGNSILNIEKISRADLQVVIDNVVNLSFTDSSILLNGDHLFSEISKITFSDNVATNIDNFRFNNNLVNDNLKIWISNLNIYCSLDNNQIVGAQLFDLAGKSIIRKKQTPEKTIVLNNKQLTCGIYLIRVSTEKKSFSQLIQITK